MTLKNLDTAGAGHIGIGNIALLIASTLLSLLLLETVYRLLDGKSLTTFPNHVAKQLDMFKDYGDSNRYDGLLGWQLRENVLHRDLNPAGKSITVGEYGVRMNSATITPVPFDAILAVGDSFTFGSEVNDDESWPAHFEHLLQQGVINAGQGGYGVDQIVLRTELLASKLMPKTIIVMILSQDIIRNAFDIFGGGGKPYFTVNNGTLIHHNNPVPRISSNPRDIGTWQSLLGYSYALHKLMVKLNPDWWIDNNRRNRQILPTSMAVESSCLLLERLAELRTAETPRIIIGFIYGGGEVSKPEKPHFVPPVVECTRKAGFEVIDFWDDFVNMPISELKKHYVMHEELPNPWGHMSSVGNAYIARGIYSRFFNSSFKSSDNISPIQTNNRERQ